MKIDAKKFLEATGHAPEQDDLERSNCPKAGQLGHWGCGWNHEANLPCFMQYPSDLKEKINGR